MECQNECRKSFINHEFYMTRHSDDLTPNVRFPRNLFSYGCVLYSVTHVQSSPVQVSFHSDLHGLHLRSRVPFAARCEAINGSSDLRKFLGSESNLPRRPILFETGDSLRARDRDDVFTLCSNPSKRELCRSNIFLGRDSCQFVYDLSVVHRSVLTTRLCEVTRLTATFFSKFSLEKRGCWRRLSLGSKSS